MKKAVFILIFLFIFTLTVRAETDYSGQYEASGAEELYDLLEGESAGFFDRLEIDISDPDWVNRLELRGIYEEIAELIKTGFKGPLISCMGMLAVMLFIAVCSTFPTFAPYSETASYLFVLASAAGLLAPLFSLIAAAGSAVKGISTLMSGFIPVYTGILTASGRGITASGMSYMLLAAASGVGALSAFVIVPLMSCYLGLGTVGAMLPTAGVGRLGEAIKKTAMWILSLSLTLFLGLLSVQTAVNAAADNLGLKTARFVLGSFVPVAGGALSETLTTLMGSVKLLGSSVGMFGVLAVAFTVLPPVIELLAWRITFFGLDAAAELLGVRVRTDILKAADNVMAVLIGVLLFTAALFIISLAVIAGR